MVIRFKSIILTLTFLQPEGTINRGDGVSACHFGVKNK